MGLSLNVDVSIVTVFFQGIISFFSPCILPLIPLYIGYLSGGTYEVLEDGKVVYQRKKVMIHTFCFVIGISFSFFILGLGVSFLGSFFNSNQMIFTMIGGIFILIFGLYQLGLFGKSSFLSKERRLPFSMNKLAMSPITAFMMGFVFSFSWTPCVGPTLSSVLIMSASSNTRWMGMLFIIVYTLGFVLPFLAVGFFTTSVLEFFKKHMNIIKYSVKIGAILMIIIGSTMIWNSRSLLIGNLLDNDTHSNDEQKAEEKVVPAPDFTLVDQYGKKHKLSNYRGKTVFLNFWATWCGPCRSEMPHIQKIYDEYKNNKNEDVVILGVAAPLIGQEKDQAGIKSFLDKNDYSYPTLMDKDGKIFSQYNISSFPTTFMIDKNGNIFGYINGAINEEVIRDIIDQTVTGKRK